MLGGLFSWSRTKRPSNKWLLLVGLVVVALYAWRSQRVRETARLNTVPSPGSVKKAIVMATTRGDDNSWVQSLRPEWTPYIYTASYFPQPGYFLKPSYAKGREAVAYFDFIIDNYEALPEFIAFVHANKRQWHNDILGPNSLPILQNIRSDAVRRLGYVNLRCEHFPNCPVSINTFDPTDKDVRIHDIRAYFPKVYQLLFDVQDENLIPPRIGHMCCGQFVVSRERILERPKTDYLRMRQWIYDTKENSQTIGWVFESTWHIIFGMEPLYCPSLEDCRCNLLGWCATSEDNKPYLDNTD